MSLVVYSAACILGVAALLILRRPRRALSDPLNASTCAAILLGGVCFVCSAPATLAAVNELTGVPNFGAPMTYSAISAFSASLMILLINWRGGPAERIRRWVYSIGIAYTLVIAGVIALFALADAPEERLTDLDTYYANTPYMREMIVLYLVGHAVCTLVMCVVCVRWSREVTGILRAGLRLIMAGLALDFVGFVAAKTTAVAARWAGHDLDVLSTVVAPPAVSLGGLVFSAGFVLPRLLPAALAQWRSYGDHRALAPLWAELRTVPTAPKPSPPRWQLPRGRLYYREVRILDALLALQSRYDGQVRERAYAQARGQGACADEAHLRAVAAMVVDAARQSPQAEDRVVTEPVDASRLPTSAFCDTGELVRLSRALARPPAVGSDREGTVRASHG
ncbi:MAB_1171c family putative transporter [Streptomyces sp. NPDC048297]|uniref:MAB_1171c family putative transporter n=1 Tax=Streptomyces sp. NPDC048297 TaxID=3365531 RepID=UPI00371F56D0